uniref:Uncharacterized protein n=1 Tax=Anguilla anguilla TaxID=7936 RepID=A0A0E9UW31_ANGAN
MYPRVHFQLLPVPATNKTK